MCWRCWMCRAKQSKRSAVSTGMPHNQVGGGNQKPNAYMKNSPLFVITFASALALVAGCKSAQARLPHLGDATRVRDSAGKTGDLSTAPFADGKAVDSVNGGAVAG